MPEAFPGASKIVQSQVGNGLWLLIGPTGVGKSVFTKQFIWEGLREGIPSVYVITDEAPRFAVQSMKALGFDVETFLKNEELVIVDCYSPRAQLPSDSKFSANPEIASDVSIAIEHARRRFSRMRFVIDSVTTIVMNIAPISGQRFMQVITSRIRESSVGILTMEAGVPDPNFMNFFRYLFDGVFEMKIEESESGLQRYFRVFSLRGVKHSSGWFPCAITDRGVVIG